MKTKQRRRVATRPRPPLELSVVSRGFHEEGAVAYARKKIVHAARAAPRPVLFGRLKLTQEPHRSVERPALAEVMLDLEGHPVRAHVAARDLREASDLLEQRLRRKLKDFQHKSEFLRQFTGAAEPGEWRRGDRPAYRPDYFPRPAPEREIVRRKTFAFGRLTPIEAAFEMDMLDHDFHLFLEAESGGDAVIYRLPDDRYGLMRVEPADTGALQGIVIVPGRPPTMHVEEAVHRLNTAGEEFVFFIDAATRRGNVLYRRYDGHYGVIAASEPTVEGSA